MSFGESVSACFNKYMTFNGRAPRSEYWWFWLFVWLGQVILSVVDARIIGVTYDIFPGPEMQGAYAGILSGLFSLACFLPSIAVLVRRLHDTDHSGWWFWIALIPLIGWIILLVFLITRGTQGPNRFGEDPLAVQ
jgi:uncharacterized membrane protein YhaH (DUF805 family)